MLTVLSAWWKIEVQVFIIKANWWYLEWGENYGKATLDQSQFRGILSSEEFTSTQKDTKAFFFFFYGEIWLHGFGCPTLFLDWDLDTTLADCDKDILLAAWGSTSYSSYSATDLVLFGPACGQVSWVTAVSVSWHASKLANQHLPPDDSLVLMIFPH